MEIYHKIIMDDGIYYREYVDGTNCYDGELLSEQELIERLLDEAVDEEVDIRQRKFKEILSRISSWQDRRFIEEYVYYLERSANER